MSNDKTFAYAGVSRKKAGTPFKVRWTNDAGRKEVLTKDGQVDIDLIQLPSAMNKADAAQYLKSINFGAGDIEVNTALDAAIAKYSTPAPAPTPSTETISTKPEGESVITETSEQKTEEVLEA